MSTSIIILISFLLIVVAAICVYYFSRAKYNSTIDSLITEKNSLENSLNELKLSKKGYGVIHIRTGDKYLVEKESISIDSINKIRNRIKEFFTKKIKKNNCIK